MHKCLQQWRKNMQFLECTIGTWTAQARIQDADNGKVMAVISACNKRSGNPTESKHTVVFDHQPGCDKLEETRILLQKILQDRYGNTSSIS
jgi:hypothetical protein